MVDMIIKKGLEFKNMKTTVLLAWINWKEACVLILFKIRNENFPFSCSVTITIKDHSHSSIYQDIPPKLFLLSWGYYFFFFFATVQLQSSVIANSDTVCSVSCESRKSDYIAIKRAAEKEKAASYKKWIDVCRRSPLFIYIKVWELICPFWPETFLEMTRGEHISLTSSDGESLCDPQFCRTIV